MDIATATAVEITTHQGVARKGKAADEFVVAHASAGCPADGDVIRRFRIPAEPMEAVLDRAWPCQVCVKVATGGFAAVEVPAERPVAGQGSAAPAPVAAEVADVPAWLVALGRKVEIDEVTPGMIAAAQEWALAWSGDFAFMVEMKAAAGSKRGLSKGQAKGVLNCWRADLLRAPKAAAKADVPTVEQVPNGRYAIERDGEGVAFYQAKTKRNGDRVVVQIIGAPGGFDEVWLGAGQAKVWATLAAGPVHAAKLFSRKFTCCAMCLSPLSDPKSRATGFGPDCGANLGVARPKTEAEALRILDEEGVSLEGLILEAEAAAAKVHGTLTANKALRAAHRADND